jgi:hypothetical protein
MEWLYKPVPVFHYAVNRVRDWQVAKPGRLEPRKFSGRLNRDGRAYLKEKNIRGWIVIGSSFFGRVFFVVRHASEP